MQISFWTFCSVESREDYSSEQQLKATKNLTSEENKKQVASRQSKTFYPHPLVETEKHHVLTQIFQPLLAAQALALSIPFS